MTDNDDPDQINPIAAVVQQTVLEDIRNNLASLAQNGAFLAGTTDHRAGHLAGKEVVDAARAIETLLKQGELHGRQHKVGDRVVREGMGPRRVVGVEQMLGRAPLPKHGRVTNLFVAASPYGGIDDIVEVRFDDGTTSQFFHHGVTKEK